MQSQNKNYAFPKEIQISLKSSCGMALINHYIQHRTAVLLLARKAHTSLNLVPCKCTRTTSPRIPDSRETVQTKGKRGILALNPRLAEYFIQKC